MQLATDIKTNQAGLRWSGAHWLLVYVDGVNLLGRTIKRETELLKQAV